MLFAELAPLDRPAAAAAASFSTVESWWPPADDISGWVTAVAAAGVGVAAINADGGDIVAGDRGFCTNPEMASQTLDAVQAALAVAGQVGAQVVNVLAGRVALGRPQRDQWSAAVDVLRECGELARTHGRTIVIEPLNAIDVPDYLVSTATDAARLLDEIAHDHVRLLYDAYHVAMGGIDPVAEVGAFIDYIAHVQYADCPGRGAPDTGELNFAAFLEQLHGEGYAGSLGLEFVPGPDTNAALSDLTFRSWPPK
jgi:hydroxypyruvate isomerase